MIAIFSMVSRPFNFDTWIEYHLSLGVDYILLRVEDTPELKEITDRYPNVIAEYVNEVDLKNNYWSLIDRQKDFFNYVKSISSDLNLSWLIHIDCDELICVNDLKQFLSEVSPKFDTLHFSNYEVICERDNTENPFLQCNRFRYKNLLAYANGKSAARVNNNLGWHGPHRFSGNCLEVPRQKLVILHFESPTFKMWYQKFSKNCDIDEKSLDEIPFEYYKKSIEVIKSGDSAKARFYYNQVKVNVTESVLKLYWTPQLNNKNINWVK